jgi:hypothetical protein
MSFEVSLPISSGGSDDMAIDAGSAAMTTAPAIGSIMITIAGMIQNNRTRPLLISTKIRTPARSKSSAIGYESTIVNINNKLIMLNIIYF